MTYYKYGFPFIKINKFNYEKLNNKMCYLNNLCDEYNKCDKYDIINEYKYVKCYSLLIYNKELY